MNSSTFLWLAIVLILAIVDTSIADAPAKNCKAILADLTKRQLGGIATCGKSMTFKNGKDKAAKMNCILKCVMIKEGLLVDPGKATDEGFDTFIKNTFPPGLLETVGPMFTKCKDEFGPALDPSTDTDEFCKTYDPLLKCLMGVIGTMCK